MKAITQPLDPHLQTTVSLFNAVKENADLDIIQNLVESGATLHMSCLGNNLLTTAAMHADLKTVRYFQSLGVFNARVRNGQGLTAAQLACTRGPNLSRLPINTFFAFENERLTLLILVHCLAFSILFNSTTNATIGQPISTHLQTLAPILHAGLLAPWNTSGCVMRELGKQKMYELWRIAGGITSLSVTMDHCVALSQGVGVMPPIYAALILLWWKNGRYNTLAIHSMEIITTLSDLIIITHIFSSVHSVYAIGTLSLYTISLLDSDARLPTSIQRIYYLGLRTITTPFDRLLQQLKF